MIRFKIILILCLGWFGMDAQPVFIDQPVQAGELILFPHIKDSTKYYYLPNKLALGKHQGGKPQFSFLRYVQNIKSGNDGLQKVEGEGGGIVHTLVELKVTDQQISRAQSVLKDKLEMDEASIVGPIIYKAGNFALVSSVAQAESDFAEKIVGLGRAPVFVGNKAACSVSLTKLGAKILWESCQTPTPDLSFSFIMDFTGYRSPMQAKIEVDWDKVYTHQEFSGGIGVNTGYVGLGVDIKATFDELRETGAIKVTNFGADEQMEAIIAVAYKKIVEMMFAPFSMPKIKEESSIAQIVDGFNEHIKSMKQSSSIVNLNFAYEMKQQKKSGKYVIDLSKAQTETVNFRFDENVGSEVARCEECFRQINLDDPFYKQRELFVSIDGLNANQFDKYINFVTVSMKKKHGDEKETNDEIRIAQKEFVSAAGSPFRLLYGWKDEADYDRDKWLEYEYETKWSFFGDHNVVKEWTKSDDLGINLAPPFHPVEVSVEADADLLKEAKIRLATVKFYYDYGAGEKVEQVTIKTKQDVPADIAAFMLRQGVYDYEYEIIWRLFGNKRITSGRKKTSDTLLYVDEIPEDAISLN
ncbi:MAG: hypothetical protein AAGJ18_02480 [Bacteroidota bacterium]